MNKYLVRGELPKIGNLIWYTSICIMNKCMYVYIYIQSCRNPCEQENNVRFVLVNHHANIEGLIY